MQRCTRHKLVNLIEHCPVHARAELKRDYRGIVNAKDGMAGRKAYEACLAKWTTLCPAVARSLEEAGSELLTFYAFVDVALAAYDQPVAKPESGVPSSDEDAGIVRD